MGQYPPETGDTADWDAPQDKGHDLGLDDRLRCVYSRELTVPDLALRTQTAQWFERSYVALTWAMVSPK